MDYTERLKQAERDLRKAQDMYNAKRYPAAAFLAHQAVEQALKGAYQKARADRPAPRTHSLIDIIEKADLAPPSELGQFLATMDHAALTTANPETLENMQHIYTQPVVQNILLKARETVEWVKGVLRQTE